MDDILSVSEVAALLRLHPKTVIKYASKGTIPGIHTRRRWRFNRKEILHILLKKPLKAVEPIAENGRQARTDV
jgi:excisionase family DNA binding protein